jgi:hypothetical protein
LLGVSSGRWYWEVTVGTGLDDIIGVGTSIAALTNFSATTQGWAYRGLNGDVYHNSVGTAYGATFTTGDIIGVALDMNAGTITFYKNGVSQGVAYTGLTGTLYPMVGLRTSGDSATANFGASGVFAYAMPAGFSAYSTLNSGSFTVTPITPGSTSITVTDSTP